MTGMSLKSPMSGIVISIVLAFAGAEAAVAFAGGAEVFSGAAAFADGAEAFSGAALAATGSALPPSADSMRAISVPIDTLSPTFARISAMAPATGEGTSIVALSDSSETSD